MAKIDKNLIIYSGLAFPLSFIGLPIYVYIANFYVNQFAISVSLVGGLILASRFFDLIQDPIIGQVSDWLIRKGFSRKKIISYNSPFLALSFYFLFNPPAISQFQIAIWLVLSLIAVYTFFSVITINYYAIASEIADDYSSRTKITAAREFVGLFGILAASIAPALISAIYEISQEEALSNLSLCFLPIILLPAFLIHKFLIEGKEDKSYDITGEISSNFKQKIESFFGVIKNVLQDKKFRVLAFIYFLNSAAVSLPASTFLFFVEDVLKAKSETGYFLSLYFFSAALAMPFWSFMAKKYGKKNAWIISISLSIIAFFWAFFLNSTNYQQFYAICFASGLMLGADLAIPPSILADITNKNKDSQVNTSSYFALWNLITKMALALTSGLGLIFLGLSGYRNESSANADSLLYLTALYSIIPCLIKLCVIVILVNSDVDKKKNH